MKLRDFLRIDLITLIRDRHVVILPPRRRPEGDDAQETMHPAWRWAGPRYVRLHAKCRDLEFITGRIAALVRSNAPLVLGLTAMAREAPRRRLVAILFVLRDHLAAGKTLAESMEALPRVFPRYYVDLVRAGEQTGHLYACFMDLSEEVIRTTALRNRLANYAVYVCAVGLILMALALFLTLKVTPVFAELLAELGQKSTSTFRLLQTVGDGLRHYWPHMAAGILALVLLAKVVGRRLRRRPGVRGGLGALIKRLPVFGALASRRNLAPVGIVLEKLLEAGVPIDIALGDAAALDINPLYANALRRVNERVCCGRSLAEAVADERAVLPESFCAFVSLGENAGRLPHALGRIGALYRIQADKTARILMDVLSPLAVIGLGAFALLVTLAIFTSYLAMMESLLAAI